jgi:hypothetical protein
MNVIWWKELMNALEEFIPEAALDWSRESLGLQRSLIWRCGVSVIEELVSALKSSIPNLL